MFIRQFYVPGIAHTSYLVGAKDTCAIVDPKRDVHDYLVAAGDMGTKITHILETHLHADFVSGHMELEQATDATIYAPQAGSCEFDHVAVAQGDAFDIGDMHFDVLDTPGHTPDCLCYVVADKARGDQPAAVFTGDTLFVGDVGRPDLFPGRGEELASELYDSLREKVLKLPDFCEVYPAHGAGSLCGRAMAEKRWSTIGYERRFNQALQHETRKAFIESLLTGMPTAPDHFSRCSEVNRKGPALVGTMAEVRQVSPQEMRSLVDQGHLVLDTRRPASFGGGHIPGSYNIIGAGNFPTFSGWLLPPDKPLLLVTDRGADIASLVTQLRRVGLDRVVGYLEGSFQAWANAGMPIESIPQMSVHELKRLCDSGERLTILDVRAQSEWDAGHIEGATHMPFPDTRTRYAEIGKNGTVALVCRTGARSSIAASILRQRDIENLAVVVGGMVAWAAAGYGPECAICTLPHGPRITQ
jgi:hydroxyacylglutathione hydrolase